MQDENAIAVSRGRTVSEFGAGFLCGGVAAFVMCLVAAVAYFNQFRWG